jgi:protein-tyrosine phosphatase
MLDVVSMAGLSDVVAVDSAGTGGWHVGELPDSRMRAAAKSRGYELASRARQVQSSDLNKFDLIVPMDQSNLENLHRLSGGKGSQHVKLLGEFLDSTHPPDVPDPYYGGQSGFDAVLDMLEEACPKILAMLTEKK